MSVCKEYKYTLPLVQHTPLLHFDYDPKATLRATELKPKIDHYIVANCKVPESWFIPLPKGEKNKSTRPALQYKLSIVANESRPLGETRYPMFFGNNKVGVKAIGVDLHFFCMDSNLLKCLKSLNWGEFFLANNFGTRQDKGYGSFYPRDLNVGEMKNVCGKYIKVGEDARYRLDSFFIVSDNNSWKDVMGRVNTISKSLRSGINGPKDDDFYFKSLMFSYARSKGLYWDKRVIKNHFYDDVLKKQRKKWREKLSEGNYAESPIGWDSPKKDEYDFRDYLGLSTVEKWGYLGMVKKRADSIRRWKSPLLFKLLFDDRTNEWYVYLLHREIPKYLIGRNVSVFAQEQRKHMQMQLYPSFSMKDFLNYVFDREKINYALHCNNANHKDAKIIINDLESLRDNFITIGD